jgi:lipoate-protein ligase A
MTQGDRAQLDWRLLPEQRRPGPMQMALEEAAAEAVADGGRPVVRVYRWAPSTLSLGYAQESATVDWAFCEREGIDVVRRPTGGGGIYHDHAGDISYSIVAPADALPGDLAASYEILCEPLFDALDRLGVDAGFADEPAPAIHEPACYLRALDPAHDVAVDGKKLSGNAQYRQRGAVIQHGSITFARAVEPHLGCFAADLDPERFRDRVTSIRAACGASRAEAVEALEAALADWAGAEEAAWTDTELDRAREISERKYATEAWTRERTAPA